MDLVDGDGFLQAVVGKQVTVTCLLFARFGAAVESAFLTGFLQPSAIHILKTPWHSPWFPLPKKPTILYAELPSALDYG